MKRWLVLGLGIVGAAAVTILWARLLWEIRPRTRYYELRTEPHWVEVPPPATPED